MLGSSQVGQGRRAGETEALRGRRCAGEGGRRLWRWEEEEVQVEQQQEEELGALMEQAGRPGQRAGAWAERGVAERWGRGWRGAVGQGRQEVELPGPGLDSGGAGEQGGREEEVCRRWTPQVLQLLLPAAGGVREDWRERERGRERESEPRPGRQGQGSSLEGKLDHHS